MAGQFRGAECFDVPQQAEYESAASSVTGAVLTRFSCRKFLKKPVDPAVVRELVLGAARASSGGNLQPWKVYVLSGEKRDELCGAIRGKMAKGKMEPPAYPIYPDQKSGGTLGDVYKKRRGDLAHEMYALMGIQRKDKMKRRMAMADNWDFFGAPVGIIISISREMLPPQFSDLGCFIATLNLLARERGLHTCNQEAWAVWPKTTGEIVGIPKDEMLFCGIALGYADWSVPVNALRSARAPPEEYVKFLGASKL